MNTVRVKKYRNETLYYASVLGTVHAAKAVNLLHYAFDFFIIKYITTNCLHYLHFLAIYTWFYIKVAFKCISNPSVWEFLIKEYSNLVDTYLGTRTPTASLAYLANVYLNSRLWIRVSIIFSFLLLLISVPVPFFCANLDIYIYPKPHDGKIWLNHYVNYHILSL